jgi:uncharacterized membrane protein
MTNIYSYPNYTESQEGILTLFTYINTVTDGLFFAIMLLAIFLIIFITSIYRTNTSRALAFSSFLTFVISLPLVVLNLLNSKYIYLIGLIMAIGVFWSILDND